MTIHLIRRWFPGVVLGDLVLKTFLIDIRQFFILLLLLRRQCPPSLAHDMSQISKFHVGKFEEYPRTLVEGEEYVGSSGTFRGIRVLLYFTTTYTTHPRCFPVSAIRFNQHTIRSVSRWWDVVCHFRYVTSLVIRGSLFPSSLLLGSEGMVHA